jgi:hypothetical protein
MKTLRKSISEHSKTGSFLLSFLIVCLSFGARLIASPLNETADPVLDNWNVCWEGHESTSFPLNGLQPALTLACKPDVNVSLGQDGYAVLTALLLVNAPAYPANQYEVDIMGPLNDTVFCEQLGQDLMVVVTELPTGNSCMSNVFVEDKLKPVLVCNPDVLPCNVDISSIDFESLIESVTDNCDPDPDLFYSYTIQNLPCNANGYTQSITVIWTATDQSGNSSTCENIIYLKKPQVSQIVFPPNVTVSCVNANIDPSVTGEPTYNGQPLGFTCQIIVTHTDQVIPMCNGAQKILRLWKVTDWCNSGMMTHLQEILIVDNTAPVITCPANVTIGTDAGVCTAKYTLPTPVVSDACASANMIDIDIFVSGVPGIFAPGNMVMIPVGTSLVTIRATDPCGNSSMCQYSVTVHDNIPPIPVCHPLTIGIGANGMAFLYADLLDFTIIENCGILSRQIWRMNNNCGVPEDLIPGPDVKFCCADVGSVVMVGFKVTDTSGNMNTCMFAVTVKDQLPPVVDCKDVTITVTGSGQVIVTPDQVDNGSTDNCLIISRTVTPNLFDCDDVGEHIVVLTVTDQGGNSATCTATVTIVDEIPPVAVCHNITVTLDNNGNVTITAAQINNGSSDNCAIDTMFLNDYSFDCDDEGINIVTLTVTDFSGNTSTCTATVTVLSSPPVALCHNITVNLDATGHVTITAAQIDNGSFDDCSDVTLMVNPSSFDCDDIGQNIVTLTVTDEAGHSSTCTAIVTVQDVTPPIALCHDITVMLDENGQVTITAAQIDNGSSDNCGDITLQVNPSTFDCDSPGANIVTLTVTDGSGNTSTCTAIVTVDMPDPPVALCHDITVTLVNGTITITGAQVDNGSSAQCGDVTLDVDPDTFNCDDVGEVNIVTLTVTDEGGSTATCTATVTVLEAPPVAICQNITVNLNASGMVTITAAQINNNSTDDCGIAMMNVTPASFNCSNLGSNVVTLTVTDFSGNTSTCTAIVTVHDITPPVALCQNITVTLNGAGTIVITASQVNNGSTDNCPPPNLSVFPNTFDCDDIGDNIVTLTVTDGSGNSSTCTAIVTVQDGGGLVANCQNVTIFIDSNGNAFVDPSQVDNGSGGGCNGGSLDFDLSQTNFDCGDLGDNIVTLTVTDNLGNTATCTAIITVVDNLLPVITCPANLTVDCHTLMNPDNTDQFGNATATDNCPGVIITETHVINLNNCNIGTITRTFTATDASGNIATCIQVVTVSNSNPLDEGDITWPDSPVSVNICNSTEPQNIPNGVPVIDPEALQCANPIINHVDVIQMMVDNDPNTPCKIITRTWTVTDNCQTPTATFTFVQTINVQDMVPPLFTNINDMTKVANANCVAFFSLIASATDCSGVTITNNSPYGVNSGSNASGNYPVGVTTVLFTATDGCGNISTMDVVITVTDPNPTTFQCEKMIVYLPEELEITLSARIFVIFGDGGCSDPDDFIVSYSGTDPFDTTMVFDCGDVGVTTFPLWFWTADGTELVDSCAFADLELRDPDDFCNDGLVLIGDVMSEAGQAVSGVEVAITNAPMTPDTTDNKGRYTLSGLSKGTGYLIVPYNDKKPREGVSTLDLVLIQKHLLGRAKLNTPYKMIAADANRSGNITALDLLDIRKLILGITDRFTNNTSWRFIDQSYQFPDPYNPFANAFTEEVWMDSVSHDFNTINFVGIKVGDINGSYFLTHALGDKIEARNSSDFELDVHQSQSGKLNRIEIIAAAGQGKIEGFQFSLSVGVLTQSDVDNIKSELLSRDEWSYDLETGLINVSWSPYNATDITDKIILSIPDGKRNPELASDLLDPEAYSADGPDIEIRKIKLNLVGGVEVADSDYQLYQNIPNPFVEGTVISFNLPQKESVRVVIYDSAGKLVFEYTGMMEAGYNELPVKSNMLKHQGIYYYTLYTNTASLTRKMSFTNN